MDITPQVQNIFNADMSNVQHVAYTGTAGSIANAVSCEQVLLIASSDCHIKFGSTAATANDILLPAKTFVGFSCQPTDHVSAIQDSAGGTLWVIGLS